jgi:hypothetical protein
LVALFLSTFWYDRRGLWHFHGTDGLVIASVACLFSVSGRPGMQIQTSTHIMSAGAISAALPRLGSG